MHTFKQHLAEEELTELFGSIPFILNTLKYHAKNRKSPDGDATWKFKYIVPALKRGIGAFDANDEGVFQFKGDYNKAVKALIKHMKAKGGNVKQAKVALIA